MPADLETPDLLERPEPRAPLGHAGWTVAILLGAQIGLHLALGAARTIYAAPGRQLVPATWTEAERLVVGTVNLHGHGDLALAMLLVAGLALLLTTRRVPVALLAVTSVPVAAHALWGLWLATTWVPAQLAGMDADQLRRLPATVHGIAPGVMALSVALSALMVALAAYQLLRRLRPSLSA